MKYLFLLANISLIIITHIYYPKYENYEIIDNYNITKFIECKKKNLGCGCPKKYEFCRDDYTNDTYCCDGICCMNYKSVCENYVCSRRCVLRDDKLYRVKCRNIFLYHISDNVVIKSEKYLEYEKYYNRINDEYKFGYRSNSIRLLLLIILYLWIFLTFCDTVIKYYTDK